MGPNVTIETFGGSRVVTRAPRRMLARVMEKSLFHYVGVIGAAFVVVEGTQIYATRTQAL